jgi:hypothetical protein
MKVTQLLVAASLALASPAYAGAWYKAESCDNFSRLGFEPPKGGSGCSIEACQRSDQSPKQLYDTMGNDNKIADRVDGGVDVTVHPGDLYTSIITFFRTAKACKEYTAPLLKAQKEREQEEKKKNAEMNQKYN